MTVDREKLIEKALDLWEGGMPPHKIIAAFPEAAEELTYTFEVIDALKKSALNTPTPSREKFYEKLKRAWGVEIRPAEVLPIKKAQVSNQDTGIQ